ncbi:hypothetical protein BDZ94DRAFT_1228228 [Collybia nuda]|uniref:Uncharacterized protein n=1 Tax=Collybia nuda TaxID=64659 RepID=A0A9P5XV28_9AGAR|nr:hypothetical protein BDZ94DRAFT_1228228 [Collybia nuda]
MPIICPEAPPPLSFHPDEPKSERHVDSSPQSPPLNLEINVEPGTTQTCRYPTVRLNVDVVTDLIAARLATSFLGHILFLKSQVPFPVMQLLRIPSGKSGARATKLRTDLLQSFDTLSSHLNTTYTALSTALARCSQKLSQAQNEQSTFNPERVYLAILVGPSMGSARSKVIYAVDGLETKIWGTRDDINDPEDSEDEELPEDSDSEDENSEEDIDSEEEDLSDNNHSEELPLENDNSSDDLPILPQSRSPSPPPSMAHLEEQKALNAADRLLSRTLAAADADGQGMANEMAPTQVHILIRAPRRFDHPAWIPRQNISASLNGTLDEFLEESGLSIPDEQAKRKKPQRNKGVEGVWITCRDGLAKPTPKIEGPHDEENELIWWSWDGKIIGFSDW